MAVFVTVAPLPAQLPDNVPGEVGENDPSIWDVVTMWQAVVEVLDPSFSLLQMWLVQVWGVKQWIELPPWVTLYFQQLLRKKWRISGEVNQNTNWVSY